MKKIGCVNIDTSHPRSFGEYLKKSGRAGYYAIYNEGFRGDDEVAGFMKTYGVEKRCATLEELAGSVDACFIHSCDWDRNLRLAEPLLKLGKPVFIDKPIAGRLSDCRKLEALAAAGAVILGCSSVRYAPEVAELAGKPEAERGRFLTVFGSVGVDEFNYAIHIVEAIGGLLGTGAVSCRFLGRVEAEGKKSETFLVRFGSGVTAFYNTCLGVGQPFEMTAVTTRTTHHFRVDASRIYGALLDRICDYLETGVNHLAPVAALTESVKIMLAGRLSRERGGAEVGLEEIPADDPGFDGTAFGAGYAAASRKIYA
ncbi:MAG TPA: Gfo/Idh/MocA family oxidoreductase [bacterium]|nr:Gfo/Idh/MocA family oxidoreductase [bacterium]HNS48694.1 Gfo/Idh/MocA family oxidoreductase [bacterium]